MTSSLELLRLTYAYPAARTEPARAAPALDGVDLRVEPGEMLALIGPSGSGKTTLLRVVTGLDTPQQGDVRVAGRSVLALPPERRGMSMMFQKPHLFPHLDVVDNVAFADRVAGHGRRAARQRAARFLDLVHLRELAARRPRELSGGQEQRVALARALAARPEVLLLDEPFSALDAGLRSAMHTLLGEVRAALEPTVVMVSHDMTEAGLADRVAVLTDGRLEQVGRLDELYRAPASLSVARLLGGFTEVPGELDGSQHRSALGTLRVVDALRSVPVGAPATLLVRQEAVAVLADPGPDAAVSGRVAALTRNGVRQVVDVEVGRGPGRIVVRAELEVGRRAAIGDRVHLRVLGPAWCLPVGGPTSVGEWELGPVRVSPPP